MLKVPEPENVKELQSWLGLVNYYRKFIPDMSTVLQPLNELLTKKSKWNWNENCKKSFLKISKLLSSTKVLAHYDPNVNVELAVDASPYGLGCVISHKYENGEERPIAENANADGLSRLPLKETLCESPFNIFWEEVEIRNVQVLNELPVSANNIKRETEKDSTLVKVKHATLYGWPKYTDISNELKPYFRVKDELSMEEGCLLRGIRVIIPERYRADVLNELHVNHPGIVRMKGLARMHVWWPNLDTDIEITVRNCTACQNTQAAPPVATANPWIWPSKPWQRVHIDFADHS
ncbi:unnamed protein product [Mytilus coruscus]|uniref:Integrase zinc-binding domain-containing protein n=1 Tax=Mytilus coruscus TaxID=42192 RepID=A0A6J8BLZ2_MYTCO|nr:unnamed protein product [Mytilus coruscus]